MVTFAELPRVNERDSMAFSFPTL